MNIKKYPPYAKNIPVNQSCIVICTGSEAWGRAKSTGWINGIVKTLLPLGDDINTYKWSFVCNKDVLIFSHGILESHERLVELSRALLVHGALKVLWCIPQYEMNRFVSKEAV